MSESLRDFFVGTIPVSDVLVKGALTHLRTAVHTFCNYKLDLFCVLN